MMTMQAREAKRAVWLKHWQEWSGSGERFAEYARRHDLNSDEGYRWKRSKLPAARFARVRVEAARQESAPLRLHLVLANGRRAEVALTEEAQLPRILKLLEQPA
jgi:hypothetical protein